MDERVGEYLLDLIWSHELAYGELPTFDDLRQCSRIRPSILLIYLRKIEDKGWISRPKPTRPIRYAAETRY